MDSVRIYAIASLLRFLLIRVRGDGYFREGHAAVSSIVVSKDPKLHLVWINDRIFLKPLPRYLTSYTIWRDYLGKDANLNSRSIDNRPVHWYG